MLIPRDGGSNPLPSANLVNDLELLRFALVFTWLAPIWRLAARANLWLSDCSLAWNPRMGAASTFIPFLCDVDQAHIDSDIPESNTLSRL